MPELDDDDDVDELEEEELELDEPVLLLDELAPGEEPGSGGPEPPQPDKISTENSNPKPSRLICMKASNHYYFA